MSYERIIAPVVIVMSLTVLFAAQQTDVKPPDDDKIFVWQPPQKGSQSMLVLRAVNEQTVEAAYLVPVTIILDYRDKKKLTVEKLEKLAAGKLLPFDLRGLDRFGRLQGDAWMGKGNGWLTDGKAK